MGLHAWSGGEPIGPVPLITPGALSPGEGDKRAPTEESLAREWVLINSARWRFDHGISRWHRWTETRWERDDQGLAFHLIGEHLREAGGATRKHSIASSRMAKGVESFARTNPRLIIEHGDWDADTTLLGTPNGTVDLRTGKLRRARREDLITRSTSTVPASGEPTRWLQFIREVTNGDDELGSYLQLALGYCLTGSTREHALFFAYGAGKNGKSVLLNTATRILGDYAVTAAMDTFTASKGDKHPTDLARLDGARLVAASETEEGRAWAESRIKQLTGGDRIAARYMRQDFFEFTPRFKLFIVGNFQPVLQNVDEATRRRFNIIPFVHTPPTPDKDLEEKLVAEHPQILAWMIEGAKLWFEHGLSRPQALLEATESYFADQDLHGQWLAERCILGGTSLGTPGKLFESWKQFASDNGEPVGTQKALAGVLQKRGFIRRRTGGQRFWVGITQRDWRDA